MGSENKQGARQEEVRGLEKKIIKLEKNIADLEEKCAFLEKVIHHVPANIYISDLEKGVVWCNKTNEESLGYNLDEILEMGGIEYLYRIVHPDDYTVPDNSLKHYRDFSGAEYGGLFRAKHREKDQYEWYVGWSKAFSTTEAGQVKELVCVDVNMSPKMDTEEQLITALKENLKLKNQLLISALRKREIEVLQMICQGLSTKDIAKALFLSVHTVNTHRKNIQHKLGTSNLAELISLGTEAGLGMK